MLDGRGQLLAVGRGRSAVLVIDRATGNADAITALAVAMAPFPPMRGNAYPGLRRHITPSDRAAADYARTLLGRVAGAVNAAFGLAGFDLLDASFSMVTAPPETLRPEQRAPHFDSPDPAYLAIMHYLSGVEGSGTGFFRQRATGIERVDEANVGRFVAAAKVEAATWRGYVGSGNASFESIGHVDGIVDRVVVYQGALLHSGLIPEGMAFSADPSEGRLTANFFVRGRPKSL